ncbi:MAG: dephospho-CoA kinase [Acidimicrobiales bacterium]
MTLVVGLTGGIGSGKSVVAGMLAARGAAIVDADEVAREVLGPQGAAREAVLERFGSAILAPDGEIDRPALAEIVFADPAALADLNALTHPAVRREMLSRLSLHRERGTPLVAADIPLLVEGGRALWPLDAVIVVDTPAEVALARLASDRQMQRSQASARMAAQVGRDERLAAADFVIENSGDLAHLEAEVTRTWAWLDRLGGLTAS